MSDASNQGGDAKNQGADAKGQPRVSLFGGRARALPPAEPSSPRQPPPRRPRRFGLSGLSGFLSFVLIGALAGFALFVWGMIEARRPGPLAADKVVIIAREDDGGPIGDQLESAGVIDSAIWFSAMTLLDGSRSALKRGEYAFKAGVSLRDVEAELISGKVVLHSLTIPEGLTSDQVVQRLRDNDVLIGDVKESPREGSILPETYKFARGETRHALLTVMEKAQAKAVDDIWAKRAPDLPIKSPGELVTLASIVEKETGKADERPRVAGVFINRVRKHMKLESDPTIVYGLVFGKGTLGHSISKAELEQATPYNTYIISGLPPGPICNPGKAALEAVANPAASKELYFVADGTGGHAFAETLDQHLKNVAHWRQIEKDAKDKLAPDASPPAPAGATHGALDPLDPKIFGAVPPSAAPEAAANGGALGAKLAKLGEKLRVRDSLLGADGALSPTKVKGETPEDLGVVVTGVNDAPTGPVFSDAADADTDGTITKVPLSPAALAEQKAREARYGDPAGADARVAGLDAATPPRARAFDASEGTPLDPLLNKTYDLNYAKTVPPLD
ncbi:MAG: endolytic transglycosylase MltG [Roseiarcus sp.]